MELIKVKTPYGTLVGRRHRQGVEFLGIRYAEAPTGELRFLPPVPRRVAPEEEVLALEPGAAPPQPHRPAPPWGGALPSPATSEDCLNLSVFTPAPDDAGRPVLVHLFGGGFETGSGSGGLQDGAALAARGDCVVVRLNFRVGALGFLYLGQAWGTPYTAGNVALLDVVTALEWVRENIRPLGGNPDNVTLFGISSGAFMISSLFGVPASRGLFHKAWLQSGSASRILQAEIATEQARQFLEILEIKPGDSRALQQVAVDRIIEAQARVVAQDVGERNAPGGRTLGVVFDGQTLTSHPLEALRRGERKEIPILAGTTTDETRLWFAMGVMGQASWEGLDLEFKRFAGPARGPTLLNYYRRRLPEASPNQVREIFLTEAIYRIPALRTALSQIQAGGKAYVYRFDWPSPVLEGKIGATHGLDEPFVWGVTDPEKTGLVEDTPFTRQVAQELGEALFRFARSGDPGWPQYQPGEATGRLFGNPEAVLADMDSELLAEWDGIERR
ncbi:MAG TPA: carboxylesterase family protein [Chloroflexia bacterium]|nr:carboxylesterase family protein [Chloroflexia bacterium]